MIADPKPPQGLQGERDALFARLLGGPTPVARTDTVDDWWRDFAQVRAQWRSPLARAVAGGLAADRMAWAFCAGYQAALRALDSTLPDDVIAAFCASEEGGNSPKVIRTMLAPSPDGPGVQRLDGLKQWTTLGPASSVLLVVARVADSPDARPALKVVRVAGDAPGVSLLPMPAARFIPEAPHARVRLQGVRILAGQVLPGDGYDRYLKPFRTIEDVHIQAAMLAWSVREARARDWPTDLVMQGAALIAGAAGLATLDPGAPATHVALSGLLAQTDTWFAQVDALWTAAGDEAAQRWARDRVLLKMAGPIRHRRLESALARLSAREPARER